MQVKRTDEPRNISQLHGAFDLRMRCQDLLQQGRARARQSDDEDGRRIVRAPALPLFEELARAEFDLPANRSFQNLGTVVALRLLQRVATGVEVERVGVLA